MCSLPQTPLFAILNPANGSWGIVNVQPSNTNNTHRQNFPFHPTTLRNSSEARISVTARFFDRYLFAFHSIDGISNVQTSENAGYLKQPAFSLFNSCKLPHSLQ